MTTPPQRLPDHVQPLARQLEDAAEDAAPEAGLRFRAMFGGAGAYAHDRMFASPSNAGLALKLAPEDRAALLGLPGAVPLRYEPDAPPSRDYVVVPEAVRGDPAAFAPWVRRSIDHVQTLPPPKPRRKPAP